jgi:YesN/AraC family two-component response regulator
MRYFVSPNKNSLIHVSSGQLLNQEHFIHNRRRLDTFVIIICIKGTLFIVQDERQYVLKPNQYIILFADHEHYGYKESENTLAYFWCHFEVKNNNYKIINEKEHDMLFLSGLQNKTMSTSNQLHKTVDNLSQYYILPEHGDISTNGRAIVIFRQILDSSRTNCYSENLTNYALSLLAMEISQEYIENSRLFKKKEVNPRMEDIIEWIRINYNQNISVKKLSKIFYYNSDYLSSVFKKYRGMPLAKYICLVRIEKAKNYLLTSKKCIKEIAYSVGFNDEKVFMKKFKQFENITPTKFRNAFNRIKIVK